MLFRILYDRLAAQMCWPIDHFKIKPCNYYYAMECVIYFARSSTIADRQAWQASFANIKYFQTYTFKVRFQCAPAGTFPNMMLAAKVLNKSENR